MTRRRALRGGKMRRRPRKPPPGRLLDRVWAPFRCLFCLKTPLEHDEPLVKKGRGRICGACIKELAAEITNAKRG